MSQVCRCYPRRLLLCHAGVQLLPLQPNLGRDIVRIYRRFVEKRGLAVVTYLPNLFFIAVIVFVTRFLIKVIHLVFSEVGRGTIAFPGFHNEWAEPTYKIVRFLVIAFAAIVIFPYLPGSDSPAFQGVSVFLGILFSLGSTSAIANIVAGIVLTYMRPFRLGDRVKIADSIQNIQDKFNEAGVEIMSPHYSAMRDGNQSTIPQHYLPKSYQAPSFRIFPGVELPKPPSSSDKPKGGE